MVEKTEAKPPWWLWPNLLSLDAPLVAVLWQGIFAASAGVSIPFAAHVLLGIAVSTWRGPGRTLTGFLTFTFS